jgi:hypothetical protein
MHLRFANPAHAAMAMEENGTKIDGEFMIGVKRRTAQTEPGSRTTSNTGVPISGIELKTGRRGLSQDLKMLRAQGGFLGAVVDVIYAVVGTINPKFAASTAAPATSKAPVLEKPRVATNPCVRVMQHFFNW